MFSLLSRFEIYTLQFKSDGVTRRMTIDGPHPGEYFLIPLLDKALNANIIVRIQEIGSVSLSSHGQIPTMNGSSNKVMKDKQMILNFVFKQQFLLFEFIDSLPRFVVSSCN